MKFFLKIIFVFVIIFFTNINVDAQVNNKFPAQIEDYVLDQVGINYDSHCDRYLGDTMCSEYWWAHYDGPKNKRIAVYMHNLSEGMDTYKKILATYKKHKLNSNTVYRNDGEISWILKNETVEDGFRFNNFKTVELDVVDDEYGGVSYLNIKKAKGNNPVTKYFINKYPAEEKKLKETFKKDINKNKELNFKSLARNEKLIAGEEYIIKWKTKNLSSEDKILFQLMYDNTQISFGEPVPNTGRYVWKVPAHYALEETEFPPYRLFGYVMGYDGENQIMNFSEWFYILPSKSNEIQPIQIDTHTENEIWQVGSSHKIQWRKLMSATNYVVTLIKDGKEKGKVIDKVNSDSDLVAQDIEWQISKKTKPGKYYWKIEAFNNQKLIGKAKSQVFEIIR